MGVVAAQAGLASFGGLTLALMPPADGTMLLLPLGGQPLAQAVNLAISAGATVEGEGPISGSLIVRGRRDRVRAALGQQTFLVLAGSARLCRG